MDSLRDTRRIFDLDLDRFSPDLPAIQEIPENPTMFENLWNKPMILVGLGIAVIVVAAGIVFWKMFTTNEEIPNDEKIPIDEPLIKPDDEEQSDPTIVLRNRKVKRE